MSKAAKTGIFVTLIVLALILLNLWMGQFRMRSEGYPIIATFPSVTGLKKRDAVRVYGVEKGLVQDIQFKVDHIELILWMDKDVVLYKGASASIKDVAMIAGTKYVEITPGISGELFTESDTIKGEAGIGMPYAILAKLATKMDNLLSTENVENIVTTLSNIQLATNELQSLIRNIKDDLKNTLTSVGEGAENISAVSKDLQETTHRIDEILISLKEGKGTLGKLMTNDSLYLEIENTLRATKELVDDIKEHPKRYLSIF